MKRLKSENRKHIKELFSVKAGVALPATRPRIKTAVLLAAVIVCFAVLAGFSRNLVSGLDGDELGFSATWARESWRSGWRTVRKRTSHSSLS